MCNFYYGKESLLLVNSNKSIPLNGNKSISFDHIEIISRTSKKKIPLNKINKLTKSLKKQVKIDLLKIREKKKNFSNLNFIKIPNIMGVLNLTPDSFSDGGKFNTSKKGLKHALEMFNSGANIIDIGGESTRPGSKTVDDKTEWKRIEKIIKSLSKKIPISLDTRKSEIMRKGIKYGVKIINDVSGLNYDSETINILKKYKIPFVIQHSQGTPQNMQNQPKYENELLDIYDFFEKKINYLEKIGIKHNNIIIDPGIGFGKILKHNINLISNISIFHSLGCLIMLGVSRKRSISYFADEDIPKNRFPGSIAAVINSFGQGIQIFRVHDVKETKQALEIFNKLEAN